MVCFNCNNPNANHHSINCTEPQKFTRCPTCDAVVLPNTHHKNGCLNQSFKSKFIGSAQTVFKVEDIFSIEFENIDEKIFVLDNGKKIEIGNTSLWLSPIDTNVVKSGAR